MTFNTWICSPTLKKLWKKKVNNNFKSAQMATESRVLPINADW